jgi:hypothetical protein
MLRKIDLDDPILLPVERRALIAMMEKRERYVDQLRHREAHGAGTMIWLLWTTLKDDFPDTVPSDYAPMEGI